VLQEKFKADGKIELKSDSTYDYLVILTNAGARSAWTNPVWRCTRRRRIRKRAFPCLVSNGFATLFLVFHPYYSSGFQFTDLGEDANRGPHISQGPVQTHSRNALPGGAGVAGAGVIRWSWPGWRGLIQQPA